MRTLFVLAVALVMLAPSVAAADLPEPSHKDIYIPEYQNCLWNGSWKPVVDTPIVTVWHYTCNGPDS